MDKVATIGAGAMGSVYAALMASAGAGDGSTAEGKAQAVKR
jgi:hypothetical protein